MDDEGLDPDALERRSRRRDARVPLHDPDLPEPERPHALRASAAAASPSSPRERELLVLEDDPYGLVRFEGEAPPAIFELAGGEHVAYCSSFSKTIAPGRARRLVRPAAAARRARSRRSPSRRTSRRRSSRRRPCYEFLRRGSFEPNLERVNGLLSARRDAMLDGARARACPRTRRWTQPEGGYFVWLDLPAGPTERELLAAAEAAGVTFVKGSDFFPAAAASSRSGSRSASSRPTRSPTASRRWRA